MFTTFYLRRWSGVDVGCGLVIYSFWWNSFKTLRDGTFPKQIQLGSRTVVWNEQEVTKWMEDRMACRWPRRVGDLNTSELSVGRALISALPFLCLAEPSWLRTTRNAPDRFPSWDGLFRVVRKRLWTFAILWWGICWRFRKIRSWSFADVRQSMKSTNTLSVCVDRWIGRIKELLD